MVTGGIREDVVGGVQTIIHHLSRFLVEERHRVTIITRKLNREDKGFEVIDGVHIYRFPAPPKGSIFYFLYPLFSIFFGAITFSKVLRKNKSVDVLHYHTPFPSFGVEIAATGCDAGRVFTFHSPRSREYEIDTKGLLGIGAFRRLFILFVSFVERFVIKRSDVIVTLSDFMRRQLEEIHSPIKSTTKIPSGVDIERFCPADKGSVRAELHLPQEKKVLFTVRRLVARMGLENLILAMREVRDSGLEVKLLIGGKGDLKQRLQRLIQQNGLESCVKLLGFVEDDALPKYYQAADIFVLPTAALEGFGLIILESFSTNTPVLATPVGAIPEIMRGFNEKLLFPGTRPSDMADLIIEALTEPERLELYQDYRKAILREYTWQKVSKQYVTLYNRTRQSDV
jgi:glycosyltransferase involved in cell wall biosynthesis